MASGSGSVYDGMTVKVSGEALKSASEMERELLEIPVTQKGASVTVKVPAMGVALLTVYLP